MKTTQEKIEVMLSFIEGKEVEFNLNDGEGWYSGNGDEFAWNWEENDYRIKQISPMIIPWDAIKPEYKWAAKDENGDIHLYVDEPYRIEFESPMSKDNQWYSDELYEVASIINIQDPDNINWKDSLVERPSA